MLSSALGSTPEIVNLQTSRVHFTRIDHEARLALRHRSSWYATVSALTQSVGLVTRSSQRGSSLYFDCTPSTPPGGLPIGRVRNLIAPLALDSLLHRRFATYCVSASLRRPLVVDLCRLGRRRW